MAIDTMDRPATEDASPVARAARVRAAVVGTIEAILNLVVFVVVALGLGLWSSWAMVDRGNTLVTRTVGPWVLWTQAGRPDADPYTRAHMARVGSLPLTTTAVYAWEARADDEGQKLHSSCEYALAGEGLEGEWWSLGVFDDKGNLITNSASRYAYNSSTVALGADGTFIVTLARDARPGNWLPTGGAGSLVLVLSRPAPRPNATAAEIVAAGRALPAIRRIACR